MSVPRPAISVVMAAHNAGPVIGRTLAALVAQHGAEHAEVIVADSSTDDTPAVVQRFPSVRLLRFTEPLTIPELRARAIAVSRGEVVAILDPYAIPAGDWIAQVIAAHDRSAHPVIGGAVDLVGSRRGSLIAWTLFINEYGMFMPPVRAGRTNILPGCNVAYKRDALFDGERPRYPVFWKTFVNWRLRADGVALQLAPGIGVELCKPIPFGAFLRSRFDHGRCFAAMRTADAGAAVRIGRAVTAPLVPLVLLWRWSRVYWAKGRHRRMLIATLPLQVLLFGMWGAGEAWGYLRGGGRSCGRLFY